MAEPEKTEKITVNLGLVDLGEIDLLVGEGFFANRTDFIRTAIRRQLESRSEAVKETVEPRTLALGTVHLDRAQLEDLELVPGRGSARRRRRTGDSCRHRRADSRRVPDRCR